MVLEGVTNHPDKSLIVLDGVYYTITKDCCHRKTALNMGITFEGDL